MVDDRPRPSLCHVVLDATDNRALAEFYRALLGGEYRPGDEPPVDRDWLVLRPPDGATWLAFQRVDALKPPTWPDETVPQQLHLDLTVSSTEELLLQHDLVLGLGGRLLLDRSDNAQEPLRVYADPAGHPFCIFVANGGTPVSANTP